MSDLTGLSLDEMELLREALEIYEPDSDAGGASRLVLMVRLDAMLPDGAVRAKECWRCGGLFSGPSYSEFEDICEGCNDRAHWREQDAEAREGR